MNNYKKIILDNGIPLYSHPDKSLKQVYFGIIVDYGSSGQWYDFKLNGKEYHVLPGYAHFLEHLLGERSKYGNVYTRLNQMNYETNAYTSQYHTCYHFLGFDDVKEAVRAYIEAIQDPVFDEDDVEQTRGAIEVESGMTTDNYNVMATNLATNNLYGGFNAFYDTYTTIGDRETTAQIDIDTLRVCYEAFYHDRNKKLVISGNYDEEEMVRFINEVFNSLPKHEQTVELMDYDLDSLKTSYSEIQRDVRIDIDSIGYKFKKPEKLTREDLYFCIDILVEYIHGNESKFADDLRNGDLVDIIKHNFFRWNGDYLEFIHSFISQKSEEYYQAITEELNKKSITKEEFERIRKSIIAQELRLNDNKYASPENFGQRISYTESYSDIDYYREVSYERFLEMVKEIDFSNHTRASIKKLVR